MRASLRFVLVLILACCLALIGCSSPQPTTPLDESVFPENYPDFLRQAYLLLGQDESLNLERLSTFAQTRVPSTAFQEFLTLFGLDPDNQEDIELEVLAQMQRMRRREAQYNFVHQFNDAQQSSGARAELVEASTAPGELQYALRHSEVEEFENLLEIVSSKAGFGPQTTQDGQLLEYLQETRHAALDQGNGEAASKWRAVIAQLVSQLAGRTGGRLPYGKTELFAMMRNAERTLAQRKSTYLHISPAVSLESEFEHYGREIITGLGAEAEPTQEQQVIAYAFFDTDLAAELGKLKQTYQDVLNRRDTGESQTTLMIVIEKKELLEVLEDAVSKRVNTEVETSRRTLVQLVQNILESEGAPYRFPFIRGIVLFDWGEEGLGYRLIESFPMIVAGATYPYQWKHDNEVNIALLLADLEPYEAAQAVRFIIYHYMWRSQRAKEVGLYGWVPQIVFANGQAGKLPQFENRTYYYFPDFRFRPTEEMDAEKERNRTSEIMQLPFFGWTVWRVYEELKEVNESHGLAFLKEVYPYVRANTEAIRTALDPYDEAVLSGRDAWVNGMDNAWYHQIVMARHLPERFIPKWAEGIVKHNRVDNRVDKQPGNPVDEELAEGRPSEYYYQFKVVFYDIIKDLGLAPLPVYHASPYNAKDVALTGVMARSLQAQIAMAKVLESTHAEVDQITASQGPEGGFVKTWDEEMDRYQSYLDRMKRVMNQSFWSPQDQTYFNRNVTQMFPGIVELLFCRIQVDQQRRIRYQPRLEYWNFESDGKGSGRYVLNHRALDAVTLDEQVASVSMDLEGNVQYEYKTTPQYWTEVESPAGGQHFELRVNPGDPFIVEQFARITKDASGAISYQPDLQYWTWVEDESGGRYQLNERAKSLIGQGARRVEDGDLLRSPAIAGFFPLFGQIPSEEQAFELSKQVANPEMWWPVDGIPIPTQPMKIQGPDGTYRSNDVYDDDKYWLGPTWMASNKPVMDGLNAYGYQMMYLYIAQRTVGTLQNGRAVEHWHAETGQVNTTNVNFPWSASGMAGSIWKELTQEEQAEYLQRFHPDRYRQTAP